MNRDLLFFDEILWSTAARSPSEQLCAEAIAERALKINPALLFKSVDDAYIENAERDKARRCLILKRKEGSFIRDCPGTPRYICCNYKVINLYTNCTIGCKYCFLQFYSKHPHPVIHLNLQDLADELRAALAKEPLLRIGTGELSDSLLLDPLTHFTADLAAMFADATTVQKSAGCKSISGPVLELKTKTDSIDLLLEDENCLKLAASGRLVVGFSLNAEKIATETEANAASIDNRFAAAQRLTAAGYRLTFHFDPVVIRDNSFPDAADYQAVFKRVMTTFPPDAIAWVSIGALRFHPDMLDVMRGKYPGDMIASGEFIVGLDGKYRYFSDLRLKAFSVFTDAYRAGGSPFPLYFCMESRKTWESLLGTVPWEIDNLRNIFTLER